LGAPTSNPAASNVCIWRKDIGAGQTIIVERAYVYEDDNASLVAHFQFTFLIERTDDPGPARSFIWLRSGWETGLSSVLPEPEIEVLDATIEPGGALLVLFNQYRKCWAYRITPGLDRTWTALPLEMSTPDRVGAAGTGTLGRRMREGEIALNDLGQVVIVCRDEAGVSHHYRLVQADGTWSWKLNN
jgi:hypothetical protein